MTLVFLKVILCNGPEFGLVGFFASLLVSVYAFFFKQEH